MSAITIMGRLDGVARSRHPELEERRILKARRGISVHAIDLEMARCTGILGGRLARDGLRRPVGDVLAASAALRADQPLVTRNRQDVAPVPHVDLIANGTSLPSTGGPPRPDRRARPRRRGPTMDRGIDRSTMTGHRPRNL